MSNVVHFRTPVFLRLDSGWMRDPETGRVGDHRYFWLEYVEPDGGIASLWSGYSYEEALAAAAYSREPSMRFENRYELETLRSSHD